MQGAAAGLAQSALSCRGCFESLLAVLALGSLFAWPLHALRFLHSAAYFTVGFGPTGRSSLGRLAWLGMAWLSSLRPLGPRPDSRISEPRPLVRGGGWRPATPACGRPWGTFALVRPATAKCEGDFFTAGSPNRAAAEAFSWSHRPLLGRLCQAGFACL